MGPTALIVGSIRFLEITPMVHSVARYVIGILGTKQSEGGAINVTRIRQFYSGRYFSPYFYRRYALAGTAASLTLADRSLVSEVRSKRRGSPWQTGLRVPNAC